MINGITLSTGDLVLLVSQTAEAENGLYIVGHALGATNRHADFPDEPACRRHIFKSPANIIAYNNNNYEPNINGHHIYNDGEAVQQANAINFVGADVMYNELTDKIDVEFTGGGGQKERRTAWDEPYLYLGTAPAGSDEDETVWTITRLIIFADGTTDKTTANNAKWTEYNLIFIS